MDDQILRHTLCHGITYDFSGKKILMAGKVQPAFPGGDVSDIAQPDLVLARMPQNSDPADSPPQAENAASSS